MKQLHEQWLHLLLGHSKPAIRIKMPTTCSWNGWTTWWGAILETKATRLGTMQEHSVSIRELHDYICLCFSWQQTSKQTPIKNKIGNNILSISDSYFLCLWENVCCFSMCVWSFSKLVVLHRNHPFFCFFRGSSCQMSSFFVQLFIFFPWVLDRGVSRLSFCQGPDVDILGFTGHIVSLAAT